MQPPSSSVIVIAMSFGSTPMARITYTSAASALASIVVPTAFDSAPVTVLPEALS